MRDFNPNSVLRLFVALGGIWLVAVVVQGYFAATGQTFIPVDFDLSGTFGDSFGGLNAFMATAAAVGAWLAVSDQRKALSASRTREDELRESAAKRDFELTFFNLLNAFERMVAETDVGSIFGTRTGRDAFTSIVEKLDKKKRNSDTDYAPAYEQVYEAHKSDLSHYFRLLYNIVELVKRERPKDAYFYIKILRATLSEQELILIGLNGLHHPEGFEKFKPLIEEFSLLNNVTDLAKVTYGLEAYAPIAFERVEI